MLQKKKAITLLAVNNNMTEVSKQTGIPITTLSTWKQKVKNNEDFVSLRNKKKEEFVVDAWKIIDKAKLLLDKRIDRALYSEIQLDYLIDEITSLNKIDLSNDQRKALYQKLSIIKVDDITKVTTVIGTMYDKQSLASGEATKIQLDGNVKIVIKDDYGE